MIIEPLGDSAYVVRDLPGPAHAIAENLSDLEDGRIEDVNASYDTIGVYSRPGALSVEDVRRLILDQTFVRNRKPVAYEIPVLYDGENLDEVANQLNLHQQELIDLHCREYQCFAVGFCPGFPYLGWLDERIQGIPRLQTPRTRTEPGSVGITGKQTAIYPLNRPGGWPIIGRTPVDIVNVENNFFPIRAGDFLKFVPLASEREFNFLKGTDPYTYEKN